MHCRQFHTISTVASFCLISLLLILAALAAGANPTREQVLAALKSGDLSQVSFAGAEAPGLTLSNRDLSSSNWADADLAGLSLTDCDLHNANFARADMRGATLTRVSFADANLDGADLSGARLRLVNLSGATLGDARLDGANFQLVMISGNGGTYAPGLRLALERATGMTISRPWVSGLSGDCFGFVYNTEDAGFWPGTPFTVNPMLAAAKIMGLQGKFRGDYDAQQAICGRDGPIPGTHLLSLGLNRVKLWLLGDMPLWGVLDSAKTKDHQHSYELTVPPFNQRSYSRQDLIKAWTGPWDTLDPAGPLQVKTREILFTLTGSGPIPPKKDQARAALRQAVQIISDRRTYGPLIPGEAGLLRFAGDLHNVAANDDVNLARKLVLWQAFPRQCLIGSRREACEFLTEAAPELQGEQQQAVEKAIAIYQPAVKLLSEAWPDLAVSTKTPLADVTQRFAKASEIISAMAAADHKVAGLLAAAVQ